MSEAIANNVTSLRGEMIPGANEPDPGVVAALERLLELAKSGRVQGIAAVATYDTGRCGVALQGMVDGSTLGAVVLMQHQLATFVSGMEDEE